MSRALKKETVSNLSEKFASLKASILEQEAEQSALTKGVENKSLTPAGMADSLARINKARTKMIESASYLGNVLGSFLSTIAEASPERLAKVAEIMSEDFPNIVEAINNEKDETRKEAKKRENQKVIDAVNARLAEIQKAAKK
jgi:hypothetical protein